LNCVRHTAPRPRGKQVGSCWAPTSTGTEQGERRGLLSAAAVRFGILPEEIMHTYLEAIQLGRARVSWVAGTSSVRVVSNRLCRFCAEPCGG
jgi:hypothetical protein